MCVATPTGPTAPMMELKGKVVDYDYPVEDNNGDHDGSLKQKETAQNQ